jgi:hypothetical protein
VHVVRRRCADEELGERERSPERRRRESGDLDHVVAFGGQDQVGAVDQFDGGGRAAVLRDVEPTTAHRVDGVGDRRQARGTETRRLHRDGAGSELLTEQRLEQRGRHHRPGAIVGADGEDPQSAAFHRQRRSSPNTP